MKDRKLNQWLWKWHVIAGLIAAPFIFLLAITGGVYLFNEDYVASNTASLRSLEVIDSPISYDQQLQIANEATQWSHTAMVLPSDSAEATRFVKGRFGGKKTSYVDPYSGRYLQTIAANSGSMYKVRKLHGELLMGGFGTKIVELIASWMVVLLITGIFVWWPARGWRLQGFFIPRFKQGKQVLWRDLHAIIAFWISGLLVLVLAGAFPWTDVVGSNFKTVQKWTNTGYPDSWNGKGFHLDQQETKVSLDTIVAKAKALNLPGEVTISFPKSPKGVYSVGNTYHPNLELQQKFHFSPYTGDLIAQQTWKDVGVLMRGRMWVMAFHQGQFGVWNWWLMLAVALFLSVSSFAAIGSYFSKKEKGKWLVPRTPKSFVVSKFIWVLIFVLGILFPLFGISAFLIVAWERYKKRQVTV